MTYGAVQSAIYSQPDIRSLSEYYSEENAAYYYPERQELQPLILIIIGWDDHYPKENFVTQPEGDGAFILQEQFGEQILARMDFFIFLIMIRI